MKLGRQQVLSRDRRGKAVPVFSVPGNDRFVFGLRVVRMDEVKVWVGRKLPIQGVSMFRPLAQFPPNLRFFASSLGNFSALSLEYSYARHFGRFLARFEQQLETETNP